MVLGRARLQPCRPEPTKTRASAPEGADGLSLWFITRWPLVFINGICTGHPAFQFSLGGCRLIGLGLGAVDGLAANDCPQDFGIACLLGSYGQHIAIEKSEVCLLPRSDRADPRLLGQGTRGIPGVGMQHRLARNALTRIQ